MQNVPNGVTSYFLRNFKLSPDIFTVTVTV